MIRIRLQVQVRFVSCCDGPHGQLRGPHGIVQLYLRIGNVLARCADSMQNFLRYHPHWKNLLSQDEAGIVALLLSLDCSLYMSLWNQNATNQQFLPR